MTAVLNKGLILFHLSPIRTPKLDYWNRFIMVTPLEQVTFSDVGMMSETVGRWLRYPTIVVLLGLAIKLFLRSKTLRFRHGHSMNSLRKSGSALWPQILPAVAEEASKEELEKGFWAMAQLPLDYCKKYDLVEVVSDAEGEKKWVLNKELAEHSFIMQMGAPWRGAHALPIYLQALLAIFVARVHRDDRADHLLEQLAQSSFNTSSLNFEGVKDVLSLYKEAEVLYWLEQKHAYVGTFMASLLEIARNNGVLASSEFLWLKPVDRRLWYMLNTVGRQTPVIEVAGLFAHWIAEKTFRRQLRVPMVQSAVLALDLEINNILYTEGEGEQWDTRRGV